MSTSPVAPGDRDLPPTKELRALRPSSGAGLGPAVIHYMVEGEEYPPRLVWYTVIPAVLEHTSGG